MTEAYICNECKTMRKVTESTVGWRSSIAIYRGIQDYNDPEQIATYDFCSWACCAAFAERKAIKEKAA